MKRKALFPGKGHRGGNSEQNRGRNKFRQADAARASEAELTEKIFSRRLSLRPLWGLAFSSQRLRPDADRISIFFEGSGRVATAFLSQTKNRPSTLLGAFLV